MQAAYRPTRKQPLIDKLVEISGTGSVFLIIAWFVLGVLHWAGLLFWDALAIYSFTNWMAHPWVTWATVLWLAGNLLLWGLLLAGQGKIMGLYAVLGSIVMVGGKLYATPELNELFHTLLVVLGAAN